MIPGYTRPVPTFLAVLAGALLFLWPALVNGYLVAAGELGELPSTPLYWQIVSYPSLFAAEAAKGSRGTVVTALDQIWLMTIAEAGFRPAGGTHRMPPHIPERGLEPNDRIERRLQPCRSCFTAKFGP